MEEAGSGKPEAGSSLREIYVRGDFSPRSQDDSAVKKERARMSVIIHMTLERAMKVTSGFRLPASG
jgi:hypothetical protein